MSSSTSSDSNIYIATVDSKDYLINPIDWNNVTTHGVKDNSIPGSKIISIPVSKIVGDLPGGASKADVDAANLSTSDINEWQKKLQIDTLDALVDAKQNKQDNSLKTTSKTIVGAINEVKGVADAAAKADASNITVATWKEKLGFITSDEVPEQVQPDWNATSGNGQILNKPPISNYVENPSADNSVVVTVNGNDWIDNKFKLGSKIIYDFGSGINLATTDKLELKLNQAYMWHIKISLCGRNFNDMYEFDICNSAADNYYITKNDVASDWKCSLSDGVLAIWPTHDGPLSYTGTIEILETGVL